MQPDLDRPLSSRRCLLPPSVGWLRRFSWPKATTPPPGAKGNPAAGKSVFASAGCGGCHTYQPAASTGTVGPKLDNLGADGKKANQGSLQDYTLTSIKDPNAYVVPGFAKGVMPDTYGTSLNATQLADLVAFLTQKS